MTTTATPIKHGTVPAYNAGCRCDDCRESARIYRTEGTEAAYLRGETRTPPLYFAEDRTQPFDPEDARHGNLSAYTAGCRCSWCIEAGRTYRRFKKAGVPLPRSFNARHNPGE